MSYLPFIRLLVSTSLVALLFVVTPVAHANDSAGSSERQPSMFKVGDEWLALPEVHSVLDFAADSTFADEDDLEGQLQLRASRYWGRLYIEGWPQTIQFLRAHFGVEPPLGRKTFVFAEPRDACSELTNADVFTSEHIVLANRGSCTFGAKSKIAAQTKASGRVIINNEPGLEHLPGPDAHDIQFSVTSIPQPEGQLLEAYYDDYFLQAGPSAEPPLRGYIVPVNCDHHTPGCLPATFAERKQIETLYDGGLVHIQRPATAQSSTKSPAPEGPFEYLLGHFGVRSWGSQKTFAIALARPAEACTPLENGSDVKGKLVLVRRGGCPFVTKAEEVQAAGGRVMVVGSTSDLSVRMVINELQNCMEKYIDKLF